MKTLPITPIVSSLIISLLLAGCDSSLPRTPAAPSTQQTPSAPPPTTETNTSQPHTGTSDDPPPTDATTRPDRETAPHRPVTHRSLDVRVVSGSDDAEESADGTVNLRSTDLELTRDGDTAQTVGIRFARVMLPPKAHITHASIRFTTDERSTEETALDIHLADETDPAPFRQADTDITRRHLIEAHVSWEPPAWKVAGESGAAQTTPDLASLIQTIVDKPTWQKGNALLFVISGEGRRTAESFNGAPKGAPRLHIDYDTTDPQTPPKEENTDTNRSEPDNPGDTQPGDPAPPNDTETNTTDSPDNPNGTPGSGDATDDGEGNTSNNDPGTPPDDTAEPLVDYPRIAWDIDASHRAIIGFTPRDGETYHVRYGYSTDESLWNKQSVTARERFDGMNNTFVKLTGLKADQAVYFRICNDTRCGERLWFRTAPEGDQDVLFVAGGDTRSGWDIRRDANRLIAKIRPLFVMHGGDHTNGNKAKEMRQWLADWMLTASHDTIDGRAYTRLYPIVPAHGNHEDGNLKTLCQVYGIDPNDDGTCSAEDTYGAFDVGMQLRVYTLNSQFKYSSRSSYADAMNQWLTDDLAGAGSKVRWRIAQYHKPMFPHYSKKHANPTLHTWWARLFYDRSMNLVVESDTHIAKTTTTVRPDGDGFVATQKGGTMYVGEGSWGAPARSANHPYDWTLGLASIQQFKVITVTADRMEIRTAQFDGKVTGLSREDRIGDRTKLPEGIHWWSIPNRGTVLTLTQTAQKRSVLK